MEKYQICNQRYLNKKVMHYDIFSLLVKCIYPIVLKYRQILLKMKEKRPKKLLDKQPPMSECMDYDFMEYSDKTGLEYLYEAVLEVCNMLTGLDSLYVGHYDEGQLDLDRLGIQGKVRNDIFDFFDTLITNNCANIIANI
jgi:hypothetical protein